MKLNVFEYVPEDVIISGITLLSEVSNEHLLSVSTRLKGGTVRCSFFPRAYGWILNVCTTSALR